MKTVTRKDAVKKLALVIVILSIILSISFVSAITGSIGNARMVLRANTGDLIEKTILVRNINNEPINVEISVSGDLEKDMALKETNFTLAPGEEKNAGFTIKVKNEGTTENKVNVKFSSLTEKNGIGLSSTIILIAGKGEDSGDGSDINDTGIVRKIITNPDGEVDVVKIAILIAVVLAVILILLRVISKRNKNSESEDVMVMKKEKVEVKQKKSSYR